METDFPEAIVPQFQKFSEYLVNKIERNLQNFDLTSFLINGQYNRLTNSYIGNNSYLIIFSIYICIVYIGFNNIFYIYLSWI